MLLYRLVLTFLALPIALWLGLRVLRGQETRHDLRERLGLDGPAAPPDGPLLWLHGASNGELTSARDLIETLLKRDPALRMVVTANSVTGRNMVSGWRLPRLRARLAPLDYRICLQRFMVGHPPAAVLLLEGDLWPNRFAMAANQRVPVFMLSARISGKSFGMWQRLGGLASGMLGAVRLLSAQDEASERRFLDLGLRPDAIGPRLTLKSTVSLAAPDANLVADLARVFDRADTFLAASTHDGEEPQVIAAFLAARAQRPDMKMILAPRHPKRGPEVAKLLSDAGLRACTRSAAEVPDPETDVYLVDTLGEMALWYALSGPCFVGGSLVDRGGHTPYEPAQFGCAILHGPHLSNFAEQYAALDAGQAAIRTESADALGHALAKMSVEQQRALATAAKTVLSSPVSAQLNALIDAMAHAAGLPALATRKT